MGMAGVLSTVRPLTIADGEALRNIRDVKFVVPIVMGTGPVVFAARSRDTDIFGVGSDASAAWQMPVAVGNFLPADDPHNARPYVVLGSKLRTALFADANPLGPVSYTHLDVYKRQHPRYPRHRSCGAASAGHRHEVAGASRRGNLFYAGV